MILEKKIIDKFYKYTYPEPNTGCWLWSLACDLDGYGFIWISPEYKNQRAHRISYLIHKGEFDTKLSVLHTCDNPHCVNPDHLFLGTVQDNSDDMKNKNRQARGDKQWKSKLKPSDILEIRKMHDSGIGYRPIAKKFGVVYNTIAWIIKGSTWKHL